MRSTPVAPCTLPSAVSGEVFEVGGQQPGVVAEGEQLRRRAARGRQRLPVSAAFGRPADRHQAPAFGREDDAIERAVLVGLAGAGEQLRGRHARLAAEAGGRELRRDRARRLPRSAMNTASTPPSRVAAA